MKTQFHAVYLASLGIFGVACQRQSPPTPQAKNTTVATPSTAKRASNVPPLNPQNIVSIASRSKDHTTLVAAVKAADYVTAVAASGPLTVFAPTNAAFEALPAGTVDDLLRPEKRKALRNILKYHVTTSAWQPSWFKDGQTLSMANGVKAKITVADGKVSIDGASVVQSIPASNGIIHVINKVLLPNKG